jgi:hypothetical protein
VTRALRGAEAAGHKPRRYRIEPDGTIDVVLDEPPAPDPKGKAEPESAPAEIDL